VEKGVEVEAEEGIRERDGVYAVQKGGEIWTWRLSGRIDSRLTNGFAFAYTWLRGHECIRG
jgi:hypothetical protein